MAYRTAPALSDSEVPDVQEIVTALRTSQTRSARSVTRPDGTLGAEPMATDKILDALGGAA